MQAPGWPSINASAWRLLPERMPPRIRVTGANTVVEASVCAGLLTGSGTSGLCDGSFAQDLNARWTAKPTHNPGAGAVVQAQLWYRDPFNTSNQTTSLSDAIEFTVQP